MLITCGMEDVAFFFPLVPVIACGGEDCKVHLFTEKDNKVCNRQTSTELLFGHNLGSLSVILQILRLTCFRCVLFEVV